VPRLSKELSIGINSGLFPVGSESTTELMKKAVSSIESMNETFQVWNRSHSDVQWSAMVLNEESDTRNLRQISAEIKRKRNALVESFYAYEKDLAQAEVYEEDASKGDGAESRLLMIKAKESRAFAQMKHEGFLGASKDVEALKASYDKILARIVEKHGKFDEEVFEKEEREYWIKRAFSQSMQDVRQNGMISKGEQILLEQIGIEPNEALFSIRSFLEYIDTHVIEGKTISSEVKSDFLNQMVDKHLHKVERKLSLMGESKDHLFINEAIK